MKTKNYDFIVMIGRFAPFHLGHARNLTQALDLAENVIIVLGSANAARNFETPFTINDRIDYISKCLPDDATRNRVKFTSIPDTLYQNLKWVENVDTAVTDIIRDYYPGNISDAKVVVLGHKKDEATTSYLNMLPWKIVDAGSFVKEKVGGIPVSATKIRELMFTNYLGYVESIVPPAMYEWLQEFTTTPEFALLKEEYDFDCGYLPDAHEHMRKGIYATNFYTADAVVFQTGRVLLIKRKFVAGKGLWALPGGHVNPNETAYEAVVRELDEETQIKVPTKVLHGSLKGEKIFDHPRRSLRGKAKSSSCRTVTVSFCFKLTDGESLPRVTPADDAVEAWWFTLNEVKQMRDQLFEDHGSIIDYWVSQIEK